MPKIIAITSQTEMKNILDVASTGSTVNKNLRIGVNKEGKIVLYTKPGALQLFGASITGNSIKRFAKGAEAYSAARKCVAFLNSKENNTPTASAKIIQNALTNIKNENAQRLKPNAKAHGNSKAESGANSLENASPATYAKSVSFSTGEKEVLLGVVQNCLDMGYVQTSGQGLQVKDLKLDGHGKIIEISGKVGEQDWAMKAEGTGNGPRAYKSSFTKKAQIYILGDINRACAEAVKKQESQKEIYCEQLELLKNGFSKIEMMKEGVFRVSGSAAEIESNMKRLRKGKIIESTRSQNQDSGLDVHVKTGIIKALVKEFPGGVFGKDTESIFLAVQKYKNSKTDEDRKAVLDQINKIPPKNNQFFMAYMRLLIKTAKQQGNLEQAKALNERSLAIAAMTYLFYSIADNYLQLDVPEVNITLFQIIKEEEERANNSQTAGM